jgi:elongation factor 1-alpha
MPEKPHLNLATIGHVDHGKSTLIGRLLVETGSIEEHKIEEFKKKAIEIGKDTFEFAWTMDTLKEERERGLTIDVTHTRFDTQKYYFTIIDCPGHRDFVKNMITGTSQADAAILVVSAKPGEGVQEQTMEHIFLARTLGINQLIVFINKLDTTDYSESRWDEVKGETEKYLKMVGYKVAEVPFIPGSAYKGDNVTKASDAIKWYTGPTLLEALDDFKVPEKPIDLPLRIPIQDVYSIGGVGTVPVGRVETGRLKKGDKILINPGARVTEVRSIEMHHEEIPEAVPGDNIGFNVRGLKREDLRRGDVCGTEGSPPTVVEDFTAQIVVLRHPSVISEGYTPVFHCHTAQVACQISEILKKIDPKTGATLEDKETARKEGKTLVLKTGDAAIIKVKPTRPMVVEKVKDFPPLGRFAIRDMGMTIAAGMITEVTPKAQT